MGTFDFDVAVIGGGSAGYATARTTAAAGQRIVVIEAGEELGGLCILRGCMPTKALLHAADVRHQARRSKLWGLEPGEVGFDFPAVMRRKAAMVEEFASYRRSQLQDGRFELKPTMSPLGIEPPRLIPREPKYNPFSKFSSKTSGRSALQPAMGMVTASAYRIVLRMFMVCLHTLVVPRI